MTHAVHGLADRLKGLTGHRPFAIPDMPWLMFQGWEHLLFVHYALPVERLRPLVPPRMEIDTFDGHACLTLIPFHMNRLHWRTMPEVPGTSEFPELNLRTYVRVDGHPGIFFFSIDAHNQLAVWAARHMFHLPYHQAAMAFEETDDGTFRFESRRPASDDAPAADFAGRYRPVGDTYLPEDGSLEQFLVERYSMFTVAPHGHLFRGDVQHPPWSVQAAEADIETNTVVSAAGIDVSDVTPRYYYSPGTDTMAWPVTPVH